MTELGEYKGQPDYVILGYLSDLFEPWAFVEGSEWGFVMQTLHSAISANVDYGDKGRAHILCNWFLIDMNRAFEEEWWGVEEELEDTIWSAQDKFENTTSYWRERAKGFKGEEALEYVISQLPTWIKPDPNRPEKLDPELEQYEKLKKKFGD